MLTDEQIDRYARHILLREVGGMGQERLLASRVAVQGLAGPGAWVACWLALAGVGRVELCDPAPLAVGAILPLAGATAGRRLDEACAAALAQMNGDCRAVAVDAPSDGVFRVVAGADLDGDAAALRVASRREVAWMLPPGAAACPACREELRRAGPSTPADDALAGSLAAGEALLHLLGRAPGERSPIRLVGGEPAGCPHRLR